MSESEGRNVAQGDEGGDARDHVGLGEQGRVALVRHVDQSISSRRARIASTVAADRMSELAPRTTISGTCASELNAPHSGGAGVRDRRPPASSRSPGRSRARGPCRSLPGAPRLREPLLRRHRGELRVAEPAQDLGAFGEAARGRHLADIALDAHQPLGLDHGPMSLRITPAIAPGRAAPSSIARIPPREVPRKIARPISSAVSTARTSASSTGK